MPAATEVMSSSEAAATSTSPSTREVTPESIQAWVSLSILATSTPTPTPATLAAEMEPATAMRSVSSDAWTATPGCAPETAAFCALTVALRPIEACVVSSRLVMVAEPATPTVPAAPPEAVSASMFSDEVALTVTP